MRKIRTPDQLARRSRVITHELLNATVAQGYEVFPVAGN